MGMTHHWQWLQRPDPESPGWRYAMDLSRAAIDVCKARGIDLANWDCDGEPSIGPLSIDLNGRGEEGYESFNFACGGKGFCKVAGIVSGKRRYSSAVVAILAIFYTAYPHTFCPNTEDTEEGIREGMDIAEAVLGDWFNRKYFVEQMTL